MSIFDYMEDLAKSADIHSRLSKSTQERLNAKLTGRTKAMRDSLMDMEETIRSNEPPISSMVGQFNKMVKVLLGQRATSITGSTNSSNCNTRWWKEEGMSQSKSNDSHKIQFCLFKISHSMIKLIICFCFCHFTPTFMLSTTINFHFSV